MPSRQLLDRFLEKVSKTDFCWNWTAAVDAKGYGFIWRNGRMHRAHRVAYELLVGPIADGLQLDHLCRNPSCVNPAHLEAVTSRTNTLRGINPAAQHAASTACPRGHEYDAVWAGTRRCKTCFNEQQKRSREKARLLKKSA